MPVPKGISVVLPNYNGASLLRENLPSIFAALEAWGGDYEVIVVDDCSKDESCQVLRQEFPAVRLIENRVNRGFSGTCNVGLNQARFPVGFCVNTDVKAEPDFIAPVLRHFEDPEVFAVAPDVLAEREGRNQGIVYGSFKKGFFKGGFAELNEKVGAREIFYAVGACAAYDMEKFRALGGYAEIFTPYLFEDVDLSYRAWKRGWKSIYEPGGKVYHYSSATIGRTKKRHKKTIYFRNRFLFHWINLSDPGLVARHLLALVFRLVTGVFWFNFIYYQAFFAALTQWGEVQALRRAERPHRVLKDAEIWRRTER